MKRLLLLLAALMLLALPALAEAPALPAPDDCTLTAETVTGDSGEYLVERPDGASFRVTLTSTEDGWRLTQLRYDEYTLTLRENGFLIANRWNCDAWYGTPTLTTDVAALDWVSLPTTVEEGIAALDVTDWRYLSRDAQAVRGGTDGMQPVYDTYRVGTPVRIEHYSSDGSQALSAICGGETLVWLPVDALVSADTQFENHEYAGWHNAWSHTYLRILKDDTAPTLYAAPGGEPLLTLDAGTHHTLFLLGSCQEEGWFYVAEVEQSGVHGYVHIDDLPQDDVYVQAARLLPDYLCQSGSIGEGSMGFIMTNPQGETVFVGCELLPDGTWRFTESQPMPSDASCDTGHSSGGEIFVLYFLDQEATALYEMDTWNEYILRLHDGQWRLDRITTRDWMGIGNSPVIYAQDVGMLYGSVTFDRNAATLDWAALPETLEELMAMTAQDWAILKEDAALCAAPGGDTLYPYHTGTPVEILAREGEWAQVAVLGGAIRGWLPVSALAFGAEQIVTVEYIDWEGEPGSYQNSLVEYAPRIDIPDSANLYDAPDGNELEGYYGDPYLLLGEVDGWYHVFDGYMDDCFVRAEDCDPLLVCAERDFPGYIVLDGLMNGETTMLLLEDADGDTFFAAVTDAGELIYRTLSTPLPEGMSCCFIDSTPASASLYFEHPALLEEAAAKQNPGYADCSFHIALQADYSWTIESVSAKQDDLYFEESLVWSEFGPSCRGEFLLSRDITEVDWLTFPLTVQEAVAYMDAADWAILSAEASLYDAPDGTAIARYNPGAPLLILNRRADWAEVAILGGSVTGWVEMEHLIVGAAQADVKHLSLWDLPGIELGCQKDEIPVLLQPEGEIVLTVLNGRRHTILRVLGTWEGGWLHVYDSDIPGGEGFVHEDDLVPVYDGLG